MHIDMPPRVSTPAQVPTKRAALAIASPPPGASQRAPALRLASPAHAAVALHVIDLENLAGALAVDASVIGHLYDAYVAAAASKPGDRWTIATSHFAAPRLLIHWPRHSATRKLRSGPSGADRALLSYLDVPQNLNRVGTVVIGSGDGIFTAVALELRRRGIHVVVVTRREALSSRLRMAADEVRFLPADVDAPTPRRTAGGARQEFLAEAS